MTSKSVQSTGNLCAISGVNAQGRNTVENHPGQLRFFSAGHNKYFNFQVFQAMNRGKVLR